MIQSLQLDIGYRQIQCILHKELKFTQILLSIWVDRRTLPKDNRKKTAFQKPQFSFPGSCLASMLETTI